MFLPLCVWWSLVIFSAAWQVFKRILHGFLVLLIQTAEQHSMREQGAKISAVTVDKFTKKDSLYLTHSNKMNEWTTGLWGNGNANPAFPQLQGLTNMPNHDGKNTPWWTTQNCGFLLFLVFLCEVKVNYLVWGRAAQLVCSARDKS